jgi:F-type H+-transporting ATPase subunit b
MKIDLWTLALQTVNVLLLAWLLHRFLYRPVRRILEQRRQQSTQLLEQARQTQAQAQAAHDALQTERRELEAARERARSEAEALADAERKRRLAQVDVDIAAHAETARAALAAERRAAEAALAKEAATLAVDIAQSLLQKLPQATALEAFLDGACAELQRLPRGSRAGAAPDIEVVTAAALDEAGRGLCRTRIASALNTEPQLHFRVDPALIAGVELHLPHVVVRNHWAQDLAHVLAALHADADAA